MHLLNWGPQRQMDATARAEKIGIYDITSCAGFWMADGDSTRPAIWISVLY